MSSLFYLALLLFCILKIPSLDLAPPRIVSTVGGPSIWRAIRRQFVSMLMRAMNGLLGRASEGLAGDITVTACPDVGAEAGQMHDAFLLNVRGAFTAGYPFNYISQTPHFNFVDSSRGTEISSTIGVGFHRLFLAFTHAFLFKK
ncbi:hypothetical protein C8R44DRAFT_859102 [Mycena epipterygia]|nr:hypothetical protein C8R44DRAFT_859102 [Mycena epipterygia]